jgi:ferredoxin
MLKITIDQDACVGTGNCAYWAPGTFDLDDDGHSSVLDSPKEDEHAIRVAAEACPVRAITVEVVEEPAAERA